MSDINVLRFCTGILVVCVICYIVTMIFRRIRCRRMTRVKYLYTDGLSFLDSFKGGGFRAKSVLPTGMSGFSGSNGTTNDYNFLSYKKGYPLPMVMNGLVIQPLKEGSDLKRGSSRKSREKKVDRFLGAAGYTPDEFESRMLGREGFSFHPGSIDALKKLEGFADYKFLENFPPGRIPQRASHPGGVVERPPRLAF